MFSRRETARIPIELAESTKSLMGGLAGTGHRPGDGTFVWLLQVKASATMSGVPTDFRALELAQGRVARY
jgi:hypothetical protein